MCPVLTGRSRGPADLDVFRGLKPVSGAFPGRLGRRVRMTILCNSPLPADLPRPWCQKKEAPLPARILTISTHQTGQDLNRMLERNVGDHMESEQGRYLASRRRQYASVPLSHFLPLA